ncbi:MAG: FAD:protein FMN transferase [Candidatus Hydrogenedentes bacterium]|nr:FAD:protein FMN transferase [Candidatus Hydrogenedentota bacterium]
MSRPRPIAFKSAALAALLCCLAAGCTRRPPVPDTTVLSGAIMGTTYHVKVVGELDPAATNSAAAAVDAALQRVDGLMSTYKPDSEISRLNQHGAGEPFPLSEETFAVIALAVEVGAKSGGAFDITVGPLVNAWGFGPEAGRDPPPEEIARLRALTGPDKLALDAEAKTVTKAEAGVYCDLSAIAKGYAVDRAAAALDALGHANYMVEVGGEVRAAGRNANGVPWRIAIEKPRDYERAVQEVVALDGVSLATSGDYRNFYESGGRRVSHTIDPKTGQPVNHALASASVIHEECALADAYATALMALGPDAGEAFARAHDLAVLFIVHGEGDELLVRETPAFAPYVVARPSAP